MEDKSFQELKRTIFEGMEEVEGRYTIKLLEATVAKDVDKINEIKQGIKKSQRMRKMILKMNPQQFKMFFGGEESNEDDDDDDDSES